MQIYLIPKSENWDYQLNNIWPITLLKTFRKYLTKILTKRLSKIMAKKEILKGPNFARLSGCSTAEAIHLVEIIVEEAKENRKELWVVLQDMKKAYDSVSIRTLRFALQRVKLPDQVITIVH